MVLDAYNYNTTTNNNSSNDDDDDDEERRRRPRVLAVTASPASHRDPEKLQHKMARLLGRLGAAIHVVPVMKAAAAGAAGAATGPGPAGAAGPAGPQQQQAPAHLQTAALAAARPPATRQVAMRDVDVALIRRLQACALTTAVDLAEALQELQPAGEHAERELCELQEKLWQAAAATLRRQQQEGAPLTVVLNDIGVVIGERGIARRFAERYRCPRLHRAARLLDQLRKCVEFTEDAGCEAALPHLALKAARMAVEEQQQEEEEQGEMEEEEEEEEDEMEEEEERQGQGQEEGQGEEKEQGEGEEGQGEGVVAISGGASTGVNARGGGGGGFLTQLRAAAATLQLPSGAEAAAQLAAAREAAEGPKPGNSCGDVALRVSKVARALLVDGRGGLLQPFGSGSTVQLLQPLQPQQPQPQQPPQQQQAGAAALQLVRGCFTSGVLEASTFPKFWTLIEFLQGYGPGPAAATAAAGAAAAVAGSGSSNSSGGGGDCFRGIVCVRTRQAVYHLADMIRRTAQLAHVEAFEMNGRGSTAGKRLLLTSPSPQQQGPSQPPPPQLPQQQQQQQQDRHSRGMSDGDKEAVLRWFRVGGQQAAPAGGGGGVSCKVLIATPVAEEGLDVPSCEFVVRYNAAATGIQRTQSQVRARAFDRAVFVTILQDGSLDTHLDDKSRQEQSVMDGYLRLREKEEGAGAGAAGAAAAAAAGSCSSSSRAAAG
ncbi:hypothetical protein HYH02_008989 [Chlamydomonas schloesseri]|uniref:Helicase C-terminal domain-containing protein n=1 Tax=Chlamydomonas schloesseri TaxID=2026947 RepID=A0A835WD30_9CHLO|nr:hypothetical protein HYH02_008989 [Chlamydomonas schloesseri]|eukprot:KAG2445123.1 hypothetical protein HYH02_008989 [Chlamydomonas schloesseri]